MTKPKPIYQHIEDKHQVKITQLIEDKNKRRPSCSVCKM